MWPLPFQGSAVYHLEHQVSHWICFLQTQEQRIQTQLPQKTFGPQQHHLSPGGACKDEYLQAIQVLAPLFQFFGTFLHDNENAGGSAICIHRDLLFEGAIVSHVIACQGRNHLVNIQSGRHNLIINVHFEPEPTLRQLRGRLRLIHSHWPAYPSGVGIILGDFNM